jgi:hypothetical protein
MGETKMNEIECKIAEALRILDLQDSERAWIATLQAQQAIRQAFQEQRVQYEMKIAVLRTDIERLKNVARAGDVWLREGHQPAQALNSAPPQGGSGVPLSGKISRLKRRGAELEGRL